VKGEVITLTEGLHSALGPSSSERWLEGCPGSVLATKDIKGGQTEYAAFGTASHELSLWAREHGKPAEAWKGTTLVVGDYSFKVGKPMYEGVQTFIDQCDWVEGDAYFEKMVHYAHWVSGGFGTGDDFRIKDGLCTITDLKMGTGVKVFARDNSQMKLYALGCVSSLAWMYEFDHFVLKICQPRLRHFEEFEISLGHLMQWAYDEVRPAAKLALTPGAPIRAGSWCKFCKIKDTCEVRANYKAEMRNRDLNAETEFDDLTETQ
jgi:hypothetical protein